MFKISIKIWSFWCIYWYQNLVFRSFGYHWAGSLLTVRYNELLDIKILKKIKVLKKKINCWQAKFFLFLVLTYYKLIFWQVFVYVLYLYWNYTTLQQLMHLFLLYNSWKLFDFIVLVLFNILNTPFWLKKKSCRGDCCELLCLWEVCLMVHDQLKF